jgi:DNA-binding NarL/FixJ family response regulator
MVLSIAHLPSKIIRVLVADDHPIVRDGLAAVLNTKPNIEVVAQASNGREVVEHYRVHQPDVAIVDLRMPEMDGVAAITAVRAEFPDACFIMLTIYDGDEAIFQGFRAGAKAYLLKDTPCDEIADVIREVCRGERHLSSEIGKKLAARMELPTLSDRECQVLKLVSSGKNNKGVAETLSISESTVKFHINNILNKLGASDRTHAVMLALKRGLIQL